MSEDLTEVVNGLARVRGSLWLIPETYRDLEVWISFPPDRRETRMLQPPRGTDFEQQLPQSG